MDPKPNADPAAPAAGGEEKKPQDFESAFSEFAKDKVDPSSSSAQPAADAAASAVPAVEAKPASPDAAKPADQAGAAKPADGAAAAPAKEDPWKDAPQALREAHEKALAEERTAREKAEQKASSAEGRYKAAQSKASELERIARSGGSSAAAPAAQPAAAPAAAPAAPAAKPADKPAAPAGGDPAADAQAPQMPPEWKQLQDTLPDVAKAVEARFGAVDKAVKEALAAVKPLQEDRAVGFAREQRTLLDGAYPGWDKAVKTPEFNTWIKQQPQAVRDLALSDYAADNAALLEYYGYEPKKPNPEPSPAPAPAAGGKSAAQIAAERNQRLERGASVRGSGAAPIADAPDSFEAAFAFYARKRQEGRRSA